MSECERPCWGEERKVRPSFDAAFVWSFSQAHLAAKTHGTPAQDFYCLKNSHVQQHLLLHHLRGILHSVPLLQQGQCQLLPLSRIPCARHCVQTRDFDLWTKGDELSIRKKIAAHGSPEKSESSKGSNVFQLRLHRVISPSKTKLVKHKAALYGSYFN